MKTPNLTFMCTCPCCGKPVQLQLIEIGGVITSAVLFHISREATHEEISELGYELGGEVEIGKFETIQQQDMDQ
jgi:hypothetical protein